MKYRISCGRLHTSFQSESHDMFVVCNHAASALAKRKDGAYTMLGKELIVRCLETDVEDDVKRSFCVSLLGTFGRMFLGKIYAVVS